MRTIFTLSLFVIFAVNCFAQGLKFNGNNSPIEARTSYVVFNDEKVCVSKGIVVAFKAVINNTRSYGNILRLKLDDRNLTYNVIYRQDDSGIQEFKLNEEGKDNLITIKLEKNSLHQGQWFAVNLSFDIEKKSISLRVLNSQKEAKIVELPQTICPVIHFGKGDYVVDVPDFSIKELKIKADVKLFKFPLNESKGTEVHELNGLVLGKVINPVWLINDSFHWKKILSVSSNTVAGANFDNEKQQLLLFNQDSLYTFHLPSRTLQKVAYSNPLPVKLQLGNSFIYQQRLYVYEVNNLPDKACTMAAIDLLKYKCFPVSTAALPMQLHHHTGFVDSANQRYIIAGGFGNQRYNSNILSFDLKRSVWDTLKIQGDKTEPRYFASSYYDQKKNRMYIYGGMGNESGDYTIGRRYFYDLHTLDLGTLKMSKNWSLKWKERDMVPVRRMVTDSGKYLYTLSYPEYLPHSELHLYRFSIADGKVMKMADGIPIQSEKIKTNANIFLNESLNELYCVVQEFDEQEVHSKFSIYVLAFPPIAEVELNLYASVSFDKTVFYIIGIICLIILSGYLLFRFKKAKKLKPEQNLISEDELNRQRVPINQSPDDRPNGIFVFGTFKINDRAGKDISHLFSAKIKQAFLLVLLNTEKNGISSQELSDLLWPDKEQQQTKNLRGVSINQLRKVLSNMDGIELVYEKGVFRLVTDERCYCDYLVFVDLLEQADFPLQEFVMLLERGKFLKHLNYPMFDSIKEKTEKRILSVLPKATEKYYNAGQYEMAFRFAKVCLISDPLNEISIYYQIMSLEKLGLKDDAKRQYLSFTKEYIKIMGEEYPFTYSNFQKQKPAGY